MKSLLFFVVAIISLFGFIVVFNVFGIFVWFGAMYLLARLMFDKSEIEWDSEYKDPFEDFNNDVVKNPKYSSLSCNIFNDERL